LPHPLCPVRHTSEGGSALQHARSAGADGAAGPVATQFGTDMTLYRQAAAGAPREPLARIAPAHSPTPSWIHDFPVTPNWAVVPETPIYYNLKVPPGPPCRARAPPPYPTQKTLS
jgi:carotenoid cleavage dioxygenase-like enzyme